MTRSAAAAAACLGLFVASPESVRAQSSGVNPDISVIPQVLFCPQGADDCSYSEADAKIELQEVEFAFQGYLNPFVRGDVFASFHGSDFGIEEAFATFVRGLGPVQAKLGKYRVDWGSVNPLHPHAYSWIFQPLAEERFFGEEGLNQVAANVNVSFPAGEAGELTFSGNVLRGDLAGEGHGHDGDGGDDPAAAGGVVCVGPGCADGLCEEGDTDCTLVYYQPGIEEEPEAETELAYHLGVSYFDQLAPSHSIRFGANGLDGTLDPALGRKVRWLGADFKYRWRPDKYRSLNVLGAFLQNTVDLEAEATTGEVCLGPGCDDGVCSDGEICQVLETTEHVKGDSLTTAGWYLLADWQFAQRWNAGVKFDRAEWLTSQDVTRRVEAFVNFRLMEESTLFRLLLRREDDDRYDAPKNTAALQFVFSLGPHRPHAF